MPAIFVTLTIIAAITFSVISAFRRRPAPGGGPAPVFAGGRDEQRFGIDLDVNSADENAPSIVVYGEMKFAGSIVSYLTGIQDGKTQWISLLIDLGEGPYPSQFIKRIPDTNELMVYANEKPIQDYTEVYLQTKRGDHLQAVDDEINLLSDPIEGQEDPDKKGKVKKTKDKGGKAQVNTGGQNAGEKNLSKQQKANKETKQRAIDADANPGLPVGADPVTRFDRFGFDDQNFVTNNGKIKIDELTWVEVTFSPEIDSAEEVYIGLEFDGLFSQSADGGLTRQKVEFYVRYREAGTSDALSPATWTSPPIFFVNDRSTSVIHKEIQVINIEDTAGVPKKWQVQIKRVKAENKTQTTTHDKAFLAWGREVNKAKFAYPFHALLGLRIKATDQLSGGVPNVFSIFRGREVYDPRTSTVGWSDNPALCCMDWLTTGEMTYSAIVAAIGGFDPTYTARQIASERGWGLGNKIRYEDLEVESFVEAANYFDELIRISSDFEVGFVTVTQTSVVVNGTGTRFQSNGLRRGDSLNIAGQFFEVDRVISNTEVWLVSAWSLEGTTDYDYQIWEPRSRLDIVMTQRQGALESILQLTSPFGAYLVVVAGKIRYGVEKDDEVPIQIFTPDSFVETSLEVSVPDVKERFNAITVQFFDAAQQYIQASAALYHEAVIQAGEEINQQQYQMNGLTRRSEAFRQAAYQLNLSRLLIAKVAFKTGIEAITVDPGDVIGLVSPKDGIGDYDSDGNPDITTALLFRVEKISKPVAGETEIEAMSYTTNLRELGELVAVSQEVIRELPHPNEVPPPPESITIAEGRVGSKPVLLVSVVIGEYPDADYVELWSRPAGSTEDFLLVAVERVSAGSSDGVVFTVDGRAGLSMEFRAKIVSRAGSKSALDDSPTVTGEFSGESYGVPDVPYVILGKLKNNKKTKGVEYNFDWPDVSIPSSPTGYGIDGAPLSAGGRDQPADGYQVVIKVADVVVRTDFVYDSRFRYTESMNQDDNGDSFVSEFVIEVRARDANGNLSANPAVLDVGNDAPAAPTGFIAKNTSKGIQFTWNKSQEQDHDHYDIRFQVADNDDSNQDAFQDWESIYSNKYIYVLSDAEITAHGADARVNAELKDVDHGLKDSGVATVFGLGVTVSKDAIDPSVFTATATTNSSTLNAPACIDGNSGADAAGTLAVNEYLQIQLPSEVTLPKMTIWPGTGAPWDVTIQLSLDGVTYTEYLVNGGGTLEPPAGGTTNWTLAVAGTKYVKDFLDSQRALYIRVVSKTAAAKLREVKWG